VGFLIQLPHQNCVRISVLTHTYHVPRHLFGWVNWGTCRPSFAN